MLFLLACGNSESTSKQNTSTVKIKNSDRILGNWQVDGAKTALKQKGYKKKSAAKKKMIKREWSAWRVTITKNEINVTGLGKTITKKWRLLKEKGNTLYIKWGKKKVKITIKSANEIIMKGLEKTVLYLKREKGV